MQRKDHRNQEDRKEEVTDTRDLEGWIDRTWRKMVSCDKDCRINPAGLQKPGWEVGHEAMPGWEVGHEEVTSSS